MSLRPASILWRAGSFGILLFELSAHGITFFVTTHYMDEAERCSHVAYIYYGKLIADGTPATLRELPDVQPPGTYRVEITTTEVTKALRFARTIPGVRSATIFGQSIHALIDDHLDLDHLRSQLEKTRRSGGGNSASGRDIGRCVRGIDIQASDPSRSKPVVNPFRGFRAVVYKETLHVRRDFGTLFFSLIIPLLQMFLLGFGIDTNVRQINTVVYNADGRRESRELLDRLRNSDTFHVIRYVNTDHDLNDAIISGKCRVGIKIPVDYSDKLMHQMGAQVLVLIDGSDSSVAGQAINVTTAIGLDESLRRVLINSSASFRGRYAAEDTVQSGFAFAKFLSYPG